MFNPVEIVSALSSTIREVSEAAGRLQIAAIDHAKGGLAKLESQVKEDLTNKLLAIISKLNT